MISYINDLSNIELIFLLIGFLGQGLFASRFIVQWIYSEKKGVVIGQFAHLVGGHFGQLWPAITDIDTPKSRHRIQNVLAFGIGDINAIGTCDHPRPLFRKLTCCGERMQMMRCVAALQFSCWKLV